MTEYTSTRVANLLARILLIGMAAAANPGWAQDLPERCAGEGEVQSLLLTTWSSGLGPWSAGTHDVEKPSTFDTPDWAVVGNLPDGRPGTAAFVPNVDLGDCGADDESGALSLDSPAVVIPGDAAVPRISIEHWFNIEFGWDGGNLKISVNGGPFTLVPASAFEYGAYTDTLYEAQDEFGVDYNTNPLADQEAFTGTHDGQSDGDWIETRIDLTGIAGPGDTIQLRFDFGVDACDGEVGWYVDDIEVYHCQAEEPGPSLTLVKRVVNNDGGTAVPADWTLQASGPTPFSGSGPSVSSGPDFEAGTYTLFEGGGPAGYIASAWDCDGGTQEDSDTITLAQGESATCTITNNDAPPAGFQINAGHAGAWFDPDTSGQGIFADIEPAGQFMFISWFTYTDDGSASPFEQHWYTAQGKYSGNLAELTLYETLGGHFDDPRQVQTTAVGEVSVLFDDCELGQLSYRIDSEGLQGAFPLERVIPGSGAACAQLAGNNVQAVDINAGMDGAWYEPATAGQGFFIDVDPDPEGGGFIFVSWFTYGDDTASGQRWLTAQGGFEGPTAEIDVHETTGGSFDDPRPPNTVKVGTMQLDFTDCSNAMLSYSLDDDGLEGEIPLTRVVPGTEALCSSLSGAE